MCPAALAHCRPIMMMPLPAASGASVARYARGSRCCAASRGHRSPSALSAGTGEHASTSGRPMVEAMRAGALSFAAALLLWGPVEPALALLNR